MSERADRIAAVAKAAGKHIGGAGVRELGEVTRGGAVPDRTPEQAELAARATELLREEVARMARLRTEIANATAAGAPAEPSPRLDALAAQLEGGCRLALRLGLLTPAEAREIWHEAALAGLNSRPAVGHGDRPRPEQSRPARNDDEGSSG